MIQIARLSCLKPKERHEAENKEELSDLAKEAAAREGGNRILTNEHREERSMVAYHSRGTIMDYEMFCYCNNLTRAHCVFRK